MYRQKRDSKKSFGKKTLLISVLVICLLVGGVFLALNNRSSKNQTADSTVPGRNPINYAPPTEQDKAEVENNKVTDPKSPANTPPTAEAPSSVVILSAEQDPQKNLVVKTQLNGTGWRECSLSLQNGQNTLAKKADTLYQSDFSTCMGYTVSTSELTAGSWTLELAGKKSDGTTVTSSKKVVVIK